MDFPAVITQLNKIRVVRDDELPGGTKQRAGIPFIKEMMDQGITHFYYASPFSGYAQVALAYVCRELNAQCTIVCERDKRFIDERMHPFSEIAQDYRAEVILTEDLSSAEDVALRLSGMKHDSFKIPLGFDCDSFRKHLSLAVSRAFREIESKSGPVKNLWLPVGSGTLARTFIESLPDRVKLHCVDVQILSKEDSRLEFIRNNSKVTYYKAPMSFHTPAAESPGIPSNEFYDAKLWSFLKKYAEADDVWWNVAK
jgi:hypothetical protein